MYKILDKVINFVLIAIENWNGELATGRQILEEAKMQRDIFQGN